MTYQFLLFDLDDTLLDFQAAQAFALPYFLKQEGVAEQDLPLYTETYKRMNHQLWEDLEKGLIDRETLQNTRFSKLFAHFGIEKDGAFLAEKYQDLMAQQGQTLEGALELLQELKAKGFRLFAASNGFLSIQTGRLKASTFDQIFEQVFISEQVGAAKPELFFFETVAKQIEGFDASQALMIGDSLSADIQGAKNAGLASMWFNPKGLENDLGFAPIYEVKNYEELKKILYSKKAELI